MNKRIDLETPQERRPPEYGNTEATQFAAEGLASAAGILHHSFIIPQGLDCCRVIVLLFTMTTRLAIA